MDTSRSDDRNAIETDDEDGTWSDGEDEYATDYEDRYAAEDDDTERDVDEIDADVRDEDEPGARYATGADDGDVTPENDYHVAEHSETGLNEIWEYAFIVGGIILILIPEPATTTLGFFVLAVGVLAWLIDAVDLFE